MSFYGYTISYVYLVMPRKSGDLELTQFTRGRVIGLLECGVLTQREVAAKVGCSQANVFRLWQKWKSCGHCDNDTREGRARLTDDRDDRHIRREIILHRFRPYSILCHSLPVKLARRTLNQRALDLGYRSCRPLLVSLSLCHNNIFASSGVGSIRMMISPTGGESFSQMNRASHCNMQMAVFEFTGVARSVITQNVFWNTTSMVVVESWCGAPLGTIANLVLSSSKVTSIQNAT
jgi:hypothetical protein